MRELAVNDQKDSPRPVLFDTDPGGDDLFALMWLQSLAMQGHADIVAVTTVSGNVGAGQTFSNASRILALGGFPQVEVGRCSSQAQHPIDAAHIHGDDGVGNLAETLPQAGKQFSQARLAADILVEKLQSRPREITVVAVGPLSNLAAAENQQPGILGMAREIVIMGGAFQHPGNVTAVAEFNIFCDPEAADTVFASRDDIVVLPLDVTSQITFTPAHADDVREKAGNRQIADFIVDLTGFLTKPSMEYRVCGGGAAGFHVHDAATLAYLFHPETLQLQRALVRVETQGRRTRGQTVVDRRHGAKRNSNAWVAQQVDTASLLAVLCEDLKVLCR